MSAINNVCNVAVTVVMDSCSYHIGIVLNLKHVVLLEYLNDILVNVSVIRYADLEPRLQ